MGYGDEIFATAEVKKIKEHFPNSEIIIGDGRTQHRSIIYLNNPKIWNKENVDEKKDYIWELTYFKNRPYIDYDKSDDNIQIDYNYPVTIIAWKLQNNINNININYLEHITQKINELQESYYNLSNRVDSLQ